MVVIVHQAIGVADPVIPFVDMGEDLEECSTVRIVLENLSFLVSPGSNMIDCTRIFDS
jgi:hypothetical protein